MVVTSAGESPPFPKHARSQRARQLSQSPVNADSLREQPHAQKGILTNVEGQLS